MLTSELSVHVKMYCKRARLLSSHPWLFIHSFIHSFIYASWQDGPLDEFNSFYTSQNRRLLSSWVGGFELNSSELNSTIVRLINRALKQSFLYCLSSEIVLLICKPNSSFERHGQFHHLWPPSCFCQINPWKIMHNFSSVALRLAYA